MAKNAYKMAKNGKWDLEIKVLEDFFSRQREFPSVRIGAVQIADYSITTSSRIKFIGKAERNWSSSSATSFGQ